MATLLSAIVSRVRRPILEATQRFWTDAELIDLANDGIHDLWAAILDLYQDHVVTIDTTTMSIAASGSSVTGVPTDLFRVVMIQPRTLNSTNKGLVFQPRTLTHPDFVQAQAEGFVEPRERVIYYAVINAGAPVGAPAIKIAPGLSAALNLEVWYNPVIATKAAGDANPIPGESDKALEAYMVAFARCKEREDRSPDTEWLSIYATEKRKILAVLTPRSVQEPEYAVGMFEATIEDHWE